MKLPANWKTTLFGALTMVSLFIVANPDIITAVIGNTDVSKRIFSVAALVAGYLAFSQAKDKNVTGGNVMQTVSGQVAEPGTQTLVDATVKASIASGDTAVTQEQKHKATS